MNKYSGTRSSRKAFNLKNEMIAQIQTLQKRGYEEKLFYKVASIDELQKLGIKDLNYVLNITRQVVGEEAIKQLESEVSNDEENSMDSKLLYR